MSRQEEVKEESAAKENEIHVLPNPQLIARNECASSHSFQPPSHISDQMMSPARLMVAHPTPLRTGATNQHI